MIRRDELQEDCTRFLRLWFQPILDPACLLHLQGNICGVWGGVSNKGMRWMVWQRFLEPDSVSFTHGRNSICSAPYSIIAASWRSTLPWSRLGTKISFVVLSSHHWRLCNLSCFKLALMMALLALRYPNVLWPFKFGQTVHLDWSIESLINQSPKTTYTLWQENKWKSPETIQAYTESNLNPSFNPLSARNFWKVGMLCLKFFLSTCFLFWKKNDISYIDRQSVCSVDTQNFYISLYWGDVIIEIKGCSDKTFTIGLPSPSRPRLQLQATMKVLNPASFRPVVSKATAWDPSSLSFQSQVSAEDQPNGATYRDENPETPTH